MANKLQGEKSPYLLQHQNNPVNWYPWCDTAFSKAKKEDKPVFLSIGYSTCHWCHVMAHESFEDEEIANLLNKDFICVKVDREERPDIDTVYMSACHAMTGSGGWPLTILMTWEQMPFFAGTYFPKYSKYGMPGLYELLSQASSLWKNNRKRILETGYHVTELISYKEESHNCVQELSKNILHQGASEFFQRFDPKWGGFGQAPKFPTPHNLMFLLQYSLLEQHEESLQIVIQTLDSMAKGGIFDHIGGGFSRYSTDKKWLIPHFEKMLYDNALLAYTYLEAYVYTKRELYLSVAEKTLDYVLRELTDEKGGFYCGQDADSDSKEGKYYALSVKEIMEILGEEDGRYFCEFFSLTEQGNFEGKNIPNLIGKEHWRTEKIEELCSLVYNYRKSRASLHKDKKILTSWNSLMIAALAKAGFLLSSAPYMEAAKKALLFLEKNLTDDKGRLYIRYCDNEKAYLGQLDDYAFYTFALLELYQATWETDYLSKACITAKQLLHLFSDNHGKGFYFYSYDSEQLISRPKEIYDGAMPSGNSVAAYVLTLLASQKKKKSWIEERDKQLDFLARHIQKYPSAHSFSLLAMCRLLYSSRELICVSAEEHIPEPFTELLRNISPSNLTVLFKSPSNEEKLNLLSPFSEQYPIPKEGSCYYLCQGNTCSQPLDNVEELKKLLNP